MELSVQLQHRQGDFRLTTDFVCRGQLLSVHGVSGAGKTTLLRLLAGLLVPQQGRVLFDGQVLLDTDKRSFLPPHRRRIGYVFQERLLFPHLSVRANLDYGRCSSINESGFDELVALLDIAPLLARSPLQLSVGEQQRVAIGRALLAAPRLLLLDEPLAALDDARKQELLPYLARLRDNYGLPMVYVSHDRREIAQLADREILLCKGQQQGACTSLVRDADVRSEAVA